MKLRPDTKLIDLAKSELLDTLNKRALVLYIKLVAETAKQGRKVRLANEDAGGHPSAVRTALDELVEAQLVKLHYTKHNGLIIDRIIEVL